MVEFIFVMISACGLSKLCHKIDLEEFPVLTEVLRPIMECWFDYMTSKSHFTTPVVLTPCQLSCVSFSLFATVVSHTVSLQETSIFECKCV